MNGPGYKRYRVSVTTITPLHIGTGRELLQDYDYAVNQGKTWRLDEDAVLQPHYSDDLKIIRALAESWPARLLDLTDFVEGSQFFRYVIPGQPRSLASGSVVREQIKTVYDKPYLPGSSLKGALRTAMVWHGWKAMQVKADRLKLDRRPKFAARHYEQDILGEDPNHDLLRAMQVGDSVAIEPDCLMLANVKVLTSRGAGAPIEVEAVKSNTCFELDIKLDTQLFSTWAQRRGRFQLGGAQQWLDGLVPIVQAHARERILRQRQWFEKRPEGGKIAGFYRNLEHLNLGSNQCILQLGWGGGWDSKTLGTRLEAEPKFLDYVINEYRLARGHHAPGAAFPGSRRVVMQRVKSDGGQTLENPGAPMGWVLVELAEL